MPRVLAVLFAVSLAGPWSAAAQEGHPLKGSWLGTWNRNPPQANDLVIVLNWDGKNITGTINPGVDNLTVKNATLNPDGWAVHLEVDAKDRTGTVQTYVLDGKIENLTLPNRSITGTWKSQKENGTFKVARQ
jgi:hypothetical protein